MSEIIEKHGFKWCNDTDKYIPHYRAIKVKKALTKKQRRKCEYKELRQYLKRLGI